jgi:hypothetical protein
MVYRRFSFRWTKSYEEETAFVVTSHPRNGVPLLPLRRSEV